MRSATRSLVLISILLSTSGGALASSPASIAILGVRVGDTWEAARKASPGLAWQDLTPGFFASKASLASVPGTLVVGTCGPDVSFIVFDSLVYTGRKKGTELLRKVANIGANVATGKKDIFQRPDFSDCDGKTLRGGWICLAIDTGPTDAQNAAFSALQALGDGYKAKYPSQFVRDEEESGLVFDVAGGAAKGGISGQAQSQEDAVASSWWAEVTSGDPTAPCTSGL